MCRADAPSRRHAAPRRPAPRPRTGQNGSAKATCATMPLPKNVLGRREVRSMSWSGTTRCPGRISSRKLPTAPHRDDPLRTQLLHAEDVGAEVHLGRQQPMAAAVTRQKDQPRAGQRAAHVLVRRRAERRRQPHALEVLEPRHVVQPAATDDADRVHRSPLLLDDRQSRPAGDLQLARPQPARRRRSCNGSDAETQPGRAARGCRTSRPHRAASRAATGASASPLASPASVPPADGRSRACASPGRWRGSRGRCR